MTGRSTIADAAWLVAPETRALVAALDKDAGQGPAIRFVGGCVRNTLMGAAVEDIDVAAVHAPEKVIELANAAGLKSVPTGIDHGTITVIVNGKPFEVTTLRIDVKSHGRHADVAYTEDWAADAARRDFTINAIYADAGGELLDPVGGVSDIAARRVRFIGDAHARIREDFLRILRFFRFHAWYAKGALDAVGLEACTSEREGLKRLSAERVQKELLRLLAAPDPVPVLRVMAQTGIVRLILDEGCDLDLLASLIHIETDYLRSNDAIRRLAALVGGATAIGEKLRLSNRDRKRLEDLGFELAEQPLPPDLDRSDLNKLLYRDGPERVVDRVIASWLDEPDANIDRWKALVTQCEAYVRPKMPINGNDLQALGLSGAKLGEVMKAVEAWWIDNDFAPGCDELLARAKQLADKNPTG